MSDKTDEEKDIDTYIRFEINKWTKILEEAQDRVEYWIEQYKKRNPKKEINEEN